MDGEVTENPAPSDRLTFAEFFKESFPYYLSIGMSYEEYWCKSPELVGYYIRAHRLKRDEMNYMSYLQGFYNYYGFSVALSHFGAGLSGKTSKIEYLKEPVRIQPKTADEIEKERQAAIKRFVAGLESIHTMTESNHAQ